MDTPFVEIDEDGNPAGKMQPIAASILMTLLKGARIDEGFRGMIWLLLSIRQLDYLVICGSRDTIAFLSLLLAVAVVDFGIPR